MNRFECLVTLLSSLTSVIVVAADEGTPIASGCAVEHRPAGTIVETAGSGESTVSISDPTPNVPVERPNANALLAARVIETVQQLVRRGNEGDYLGFLS